MKNAFIYSLRTMVAGAMFLFLLVASSYGLAATDATQAQQGPAELIDKVARQVLTELDAHRAEMRKDPKKIRKLVDDLLLPHFDTEYAARQVLGRHWRDASPEQRKRFIEAFYQSLLQNYGEALLDYTPDRLKILPYREDPDDKNRATVRTEVRRDTGGAVPVNYTLHKVDDQWKAWDVVIEGISYVKSFRTDFGSEIDQKGLESVISRLESNQSKGIVAKPSGAKPGNI